ncbi:MULTISPECIES: transcription termination/antitermination NusG family protein [unclassified Rhizobium]|uniref:transcription termination/antitermination protein NusG n=1 Tax=unclassified Rhizobium TaxID=2613769 RepID=UPI001621FAE9|nr:MULTISPECIES: transcription termination/antitermination NusG family protein [unclassified Rhizobium]MBB3288171.1 transcriptional antiterminator NusG [Rhizobium sp. BK252]MBB3402965.1 transcriptional antiterminator NusG [Rhizobium sp. BK289]MBB3415542.1 transcriptional antiterminator NusG [Rhizobium sp. BK284]MBB3483377.1 transcriptional antiterminator NusG [Rhizobium sp. BK347]
MARLMPILEKQAHLRSIRARMLDLASANQDGERHWYVLETFASCERAVEKRLADENVRAYLPMIDGGKAVIRHRVVQRLPRPALPGYLLVSLVPSPAAFAALSNLKQVVGFVGVAEKPHRVSDEDVNRFKIKLGEYDANSVHSEKFAKGDWVRFEEGPFIGYSGRIVKIRKMSVMRGMKPIGVEAIVEIRFGDQVKPIDTPLALLEKL